MRVPRVLEFSALQALERRMPVRRLEEARLDPRHLPGHPGFGAFSPAPPSRKVGPRGSVNTRVEKGTSVVRAREVMIL